MTKNSTCIDSALLDVKKTCLNADSRKSNADKRKLDLRPSVCNLRKSALKNQERMFKYKAFAVAFSYPDDNFFKFYPETLGNKEELLREYDRLFRANDIWLYGCEYICENEFQRANSLADISGFYRAFGLETDKERPDALTCELEFMHYLILKEIKAPDREKKIICLVAEKKFFNKYLYLAGKKIAEKVFSLTKNDFYREIAKQLLIFLDYEAKFLKTIA